MLVTRYGPGVPDGLIVFSQTDSEVGRFTKVVYLTPIQSLALQRDDGTVLLTLSGQTVRFNDGARIKSVTSSGVFLIDDGSLYEIDRELSLISRPVAPSVRVGLVASTMTFNMCVSTENWVFTWGVSACGGLGLGTNIYEAKAPAFVGNDWGGNVTGIACSDTHALLSTHNDKLYGWGSNSARQLGPSDRDPIAYWEPVVLPFYQHVTHLAAGRMQTIIGTPTSLGSDRSTAHLWGLITSIINFDSQLRSIVASGESAAAVLCDGSVFTWGSAPCVGRPVTDVSIGSDFAELYVLFSPLPSFVDHIKRGFRPGNLPPKSQREAAAHQIEVARILEASRRAQEDEDESSFLDNWWSVALKVYAAEDELTDEMLGVWKEHGLSRPARLVLWPMAIKRRIRRKVQYSDSVTREQYEQLKSIASKTDGTVHLDMPRTFPDMEILSSDSPFTEECASLLHAFQVLRPDVGYVQGMSFVAASLLMHMPPFEGFLCFCEIMDWSVIKGLYTVSITEIRRVFDILDQYIAINCPRLGARFRDLGFKPELFLLDWFLTLFTKPLSLANAAAVWDLMVLEGQKGLFRVATGILTALEPQLEREFDACVVVVQKGPKILNKAFLMKKIRGIRHPASIDQILANL